MKLARTRFRLRTPELLALVLIAATGVFYTLVVQPTERNLQNVERALAQRTAATLGTPTDALARDAARQLGAFYAFFDQNLSFTDWLARFYAVAMQLGIETHQAEYKRSASDDVPMVLYEVALPVTGDYGKLRAFTEGALSAVPVASLDRITFRRQKTTTEQVDADLKFTFYLPAAGVQQ